MNVVYESLKYGVQVTVQVGAYKGVRTFRNQGQAALSVRKLSDKLHVCEPEPLLRLWTQGRLRASRVPALVMPKPSQTGGLQETLYAVGVMTLTALVVVFAARLFA